VRMFIPMDMMDTGKTEAGELYVKDSQRNWDDFITGIEASFQKELRGEKLWAPHFEPVDQPQTWPGFFGKSVRQIREGNPVLYENPERLIAYIEKRRAELGLPPPKEK